MARFVIIDSQLGVAYPYNRICDAEQKMRELTGKEVSVDLSEMDLVDMSVLDTSVLVTVEGDDGVWSSFEMGTLMRKCGPMPPQETKPPHGHADIWVFFTRVSADGAAMTSVEFKELQEWARPPQPGERLN